jgi:hypothetical protein
LFKKFAFSLILATLFGTTSVLSQENDTSTKVQTRRNGKVIIEKTISKKSGRVLNKKKTKNGKMIYELYYDEKGNLYKSIDKKGIIRTHKKGCDC